MPMNTKTIFLRIVKGRKLMIIDTASNSQLKLQLETAKTRKLTKLEIYGTLSFSSKMKGLV